MELGPLAGSRGQSRPTFISSLWNKSASSGLSIKILGLSPSLAPPESLRGVLWPTLARSLLVLPMSAV